MLVKGECTGCDLDTYIKCNEKNNVKSVQDDENPEKPPGCRGGEKKRKAASWMI